MRERRTAQRVRSISRGRTFATNRLTPAALAAMYVGRCPMVSLLGSLVLRDVVTLRGVAVVDSRLGTGLAMPGNPTPNHPIKGYRKPASASGPARTPPEGSGAGRSLRMQSAFDCSE